MINQMSLNTMPKNKKIILIASVIIGLIIIAGVILILTKSNISNSNQVSNPQTTSNNIEYLPSETCPESIFEENGVSRADYQGKPYILNDDLKTWIDKNCNGATKTTNSSSSSSQAAAADEPDAPLLLKSIGFNLDDYNEQTNTAGDIKFTKITLPFDEIFGPFGQQDPRSPNDPTKTNPQPTVILPLGTKVHSLVDGLVVEVKSLYSGDWTIWVAKSKQSTWFYETEHVNNPLVKIGDTVTGGQIIGEVSDYDSHNTPGFGLVEIGILHPTPGGGTPQHVCPYKYLDDSIKDSVNSKLTKLYAAWEKYKGKDIYDQENFVSPGCVTYNPANG